MAGMLLFTEHVEDVNYITEANEDFIEGIFMQSEKKNRNGRVYPNDVLMKEVKRYDKTYVKANRAMGELGHPDGPTVNLERVSHIIKDTFDEVFFYSVFVCFGDVVYILNMFCK